MGLFFPEEREKIVLTLESPLFLFITGVRGPVIFIGHTADILISTVHFWLWCQPPAIFLTKKVATRQGGMCNIYCISLVLPYSLSRGTTSVCERLEWKWSVTEAPKSTCLPAERHTHRIVFTPRLCLPLPSLTSLVMWSMNNFLNPLSGLRHIRVVLPVSDLWSHAWQNAHVGISQRALWEHSNKMAISITRTRVRNFKL